MIDITKDIKNGTTIIAEFHEDANGDSVSTVVTVTKKKVKTAKGDFEKTVISASPDTTSIYNITDLLNIMEAVG